MNERGKQFLQDGASALQISLSADELGRFYSFAAELKKWNKKINLTAIKDDAEIALKHFVDSLTILKALTGGGPLLDIGSGGGFPAIPLKIVRHGMEIVSVDAVEKKVIFQRHVARTLALHNFAAIHARAEELPGKYAGHFSWVVSRAFADLPTFARMAMPLLHDEGTIVAMKGKSGREEAEAAKKPLEEMGLSIFNLIEFALPIAGDARSLVVIKKMS